MHRNQNTSQNLSTVILVGFFLYSYLIFKFGVAYEFSVCFRAKRRTSRTAREAACEKSVCIKTKKITINIYMHIGAGMCTKEGKKPNNIDFLTLYVNNKDIG
jgi:hypothetical protein